MECSWSGQGENLEWTPAAGDGIMLTRSGHGAVTKLTGVRRVFDACGPLYHGFDVNTGKSSTPVGEVIMLALC